MVWGPGFSWCLLAVVSVVSWSWWSCCPAFPGAAGRGGRGGCGGYPRRTTCYRNLQSKKGVVVQNRAAARAQNIVAVCRGHLAALSRDHGRLQKRSFDQRGVQEQLLGPFLTDLAALVDLCYEPRHKGLDELVAEEAVMNLGKVSSYGLKLFRQPFADVTHKSAVVTHVLRAGKDPHGIASQGTLDPKPRT